jgi:hypothetical protein
MFLTLTLMAHKFNIFDIDSIFELFEIRKTVMGQGLVSRSCLQQGPVSRSCLLQGLVSRSCLQRGQVPLGLQARLLQLA